MAAAIVTDGIAIIAVFASIDDFVTTPRFCAVLSACVRAVIAVVVAVVTSLCTAGPDVTITTDRSAAVVDALIGVVIVAVIALFAGFDVSIAAANIFTLTVSADLFSATAAVALCLDLTGAAAAVSVNDVSVVTGFYIRLKIGVTASSLCAVPIGQIHACIRTLLVAIVACFPWVQATVTTDDGATDQIIA